MSGSLDGATPPPRNILVCLPSLRMSPLVSLDSRGSLRFSAPAPAPAPAQLPSLLSLPSLPDLTSVLRLGGSPAQLHRPTNRPTDRPPARRHTPPNRSKRRNKKTVLGRPLPHRAYMIYVHVVHAYPPPHTLSTESTLLVHVKERGPCLSLKNLPTNPPITRTASMRPPIFFLCVCLSHVSLDRFR